MAPPNAALAISDVPKVCPQSRRKAAKGGERRRKAAKGGETRRGSGDPEAFGPGNGAVNRLRLTPGRRIGRYKARQGCDAALRSAPLKAEERDARACTVAMVRTTLGC